MMAVDTIPNHRLQRLIRSAYNGNSLADARALREWVRANPAAADSLARRDNRLKLLMATWEGASNGVSHQESGNGA